MCTQWPHRVPPSGLFGFSPNAAPCTRCMRGSRALREWQRLAGHAGLCACSQNLCVCSNSFPWRDAWAMAPRALLSFQWVCQRHPTMSLRPRFMCAPRHAVSLATRLSANPGRSACPTTLRVCATSARLAGLSVGGVPTTRRYVWAPHCVCGPRATTMRADSAYAPPRRILLGFRWGCPNNAQACLANMSLEIK